MEQAEFKSVKRPKKIKVNGINIITPLDVVPFEIKGFEGIVYGDPKLKSKISFNVKDLISAVEKNYIIVALKATGKTKMTGFPVSILDLVQGRKLRLANMINMEINPAYPKINKGFAYNHIKTVLGLEDKPQQEMYDAFISSMDDQVICSDIKRIIQKLYETQ